jgi:DNA-binding SARP family transcriptional activator
MKESRRLTSTLHIRLLGDFWIFRDQQVVTGVETPRLQSLLAYLLLHRDAPQPRSHLAYVFWPDSTEGQARTNLRKQVHYLRRTLPDADQFLQVDTQTLFWRPDAPLALDVADFEDALVRAELAEEAGNRVSLQEALEQAVAVYKGDLLPSCYDEWLLTERQRLRDGFIWALERLIRLLEHERDYEAAIQAAQRLLRYDPLHEATCRRLMRLYALAGDRPHALRTYHTCATALQQELEVEPSAATRKAYEQLLQPAAPPDRPALNAVTELPLVGRKQEWARMQSAWQRAYVGRPQLVLLAGEPGIGKTHAAAAMVDWATRQGIVTASARCYASEGRLVYAPVADWLRTEPFGSALLSLDTVWLTEVARLLPELLVERPDIPPPGPLAESWQRQRLYDALTRAVLGQRPRLLVLDDVHWCDEDTLGWLSYVLRPQTWVRSGGTGPEQTLIVATRGSDEVRADGALDALLADLHRADQLIQIELGPLSQEETLALAANAAGRPLHPGLAGSLYRRSKGNPRSVVELARAGLPQG